MKVLLATVFEYPHTGGLSTHINMLSRSLTALGHQVDVVSMSSLPPWAVYGLVKGPSYGLNKLYLGSGMVWSHRMRKKLLTKLIGQKLEQEHYDVINAQDVFATLAAAEHSVPVVLTLHGYFTYEAVSKKSLRQNTGPERFFIEQEQQAYQQADQIITVDTRLKNHVQQMTGRDERVNVVKNFIDTTNFTVATNKHKQHLRSVFNIGQDRLVVFCPRRLTEKNGVIYPLMALEHLREQFPNLLMVYAGDGEERQTLEKYVDQHDLYKQVLFLGAIRHEEISRWYAVSDVVVIPSTYSVGVEEATSISAIEAMASGVPVVATAIGGLKELIQHDETGLLVPDKDPASLADAISTLVTKRVLADELARRAREFIETNHSHLSAGLRFIEIYQQAGADTREG